MRNADRQPTGFGWYVMQKMATNGYATQAALADAAGVSKSTISRWLYEEGRPDLGGLRGLASALQVSEDEILAVAGYGTMAGEVTASIAAMRPPPMDPLAVEVAEMLDPESPVPADERAYIRETVDRVIDRSRRHLRRRRRPA